MIFTDHEFKNIYFLNQNKLFILSGNNTWNVATSNYNSLIKITFYDAIKIYQKSVNRIKIPLSVVGTNNPNQKEYNIAYEFGKLMADLNITILCGGRGGIMEAVCKGIAENNGICVGILPGLDDSDANKYVSIPIPTGIGISRNTIIAASSFCIFSIGGSHGTLSEIAFGLQYKKPVFSIYSKYNIDGVVYVESLNDMLINICNYMLFREGTPK